MSTDLENEISDDDLLGDPPADNLPLPQAASAASLSASVSRSGYEGIIFDIETGPLPLDELWNVVPKFDPASIQPYPAFDEKSVKLGNIKDPGKQFEKIEACRAAHAAEALAHDAKNATAEADYIAEVTGKAALSAVTGRVLAIGYYSTHDDETEVDVIHPDNATEAALIIRFWATVKAADESTRIIGHNIHGFDLPFLIQRSYILGIEVPRGIMSGRFFAPRFVDTMQVWACGKVGSGGMVKLDTLAKAFGVGAKNGDGAMFAELLAKDEKAAIEYLKNDVAMTYEVAKRMGVCK